MVDFRSGWALLSLTLRFLEELPGASDEPLLLLLLSLRFRIDKTFAAAALCHP
ncbi:hypothetical protein [Lysinibacillus xylanilyticus]|uniref:hypothetical protein n=1 Tax=Lysinibacillus xylanilyticus TaxID=582475 RepID=UPI003823CC2A